MPPTRRLFRLAVVALALVLVASCGGGSGAKQRGGGRGREKPCPQRLPFRATVLPDGFANDLVKGTGRGSASASTVAYHYSGPEAKYIDVFRGGQLHKFKNGKPVNVLGALAHMAKVDDVWALKVRLARGRCSKYQFEGHGVSEGEMRKFATGLKKGGGG
jgi:hypothetical protein